MRGLIKKKFAKVCVRCNKNFISQRSTKYYCSNICRDAAMKKYKEE